VRRGVRTFEHEAQQPVDEQLGFAGAGMGGDEGGDARVGGGELLGLRPCDGGVNDGNVHAWCIGRAGGCWQYSYQGIR